MLQSSSRPHSTSRNYPDAPQESALCREQSASIRDLIDSFQTKVEEVTASYNQLYNMRDSYWRIFIQEYCIFFFILTFLRLQHQKRQASLIMKPSESVSIDQRKPVNNTLATSGHQQSTMLNGVSKLQSKRKLLDVEPSDSSNISSVFRANSYFPGRDSSSCSISGIGHNTTSLAVSWHTHIQSLFLEVLKYR